MKKFIIFATLLMVMCLFLGSCSTDFSGIIEEKTGLLYDTIRSFTEPFLKEDASYSEGNEQIPEDNQTNTEGETNEN